MSCSALVSGPLWVAAGLRLARSLLAHSFWGNFGTYSRRRSAMKRLTL
jgi:hypothetical protein